ncbi:MAG: hypothetical protein DRJ03_00050 [Chloroflexi bacterium]|nr:MAG: hypothetical protein DRJ03_00050 [Chloroflexota bacterium]
MTGRWKDIDSHQGIYQVSDLGRVKRIIDGWGTKAGKILKPRIKSDQYLQVALWYNGKRIDRPIHRLVLEAFVGPQPKGMECRRPDGARQNNHLTNLQWGTRSENQRDSIRHNTKYQPRGEQHGMTKTTAIQIKHVKQLLAKGHTAKEIAVVTGVGVHVIYDAKRNKTWKHI